MDPLLLIDREPRDIAEADAAKIVGLAPSTLAKMRSRGDGPPYIKTGRIVRYPVRELRAWLSSRTFRSEPDRADAV